MTNRAAVEHIADANPLRERLAMGKMPIFLELHLSPKDRLTYRSLARLFDIDGAEAADGARELGRRVRHGPTAGLEIDDDQRKLINRFTTYVDLTSSERVDLISIDDGVGGQLDTLDTHLAAAMLIGLGAEPGRIQANVVTRDRSRDEFRRRVMGMAESGLRNFLVLTGDLPRDDRVARFPQDSVNGIELVQHMRLIGEIPDSVMIAGAGHPNLTIDPNGMRTMQKCLAGAELIVTQAIFDVARFEEWMSAITTQGVLDLAHVIAETIPITSGKQARFIREIPGIDVPDEIIDELQQAERHAQEDGIRRLGLREQALDTHTKAALKSHGIMINRRLMSQIRRNRGISGFYLGCVFAYKANVQILRESTLRPTAPEGIEKWRPLSDVEKALAEKQLGPIRRYLHGQKRRAASPMRRWRRRIGAAVAYNGTVYSLLKWAEGAVKVPIFSCKHCDSCDLSPSGLICPRGCAKQMSNGSCGAPQHRSEGVVCEDRTRLCTWHLIRQRRLHLGVPIETQLEVHPPAAPEFYTGKHFSSFAPVFAGEKDRPDFAMMLRRLLLPFMALIGKHSGFSYRVDTPPYPLLTLVKSKRLRIGALLQRNRNIDSHELLLKVLALVPTPQAQYLIERELITLGLPESISAAELSQKELFALAEALPGIKQLAQDRDRFGWLEHLVAAIPHHRNLRLAVRRHMADQQIAYLAELGIAVGYNETLLDDRWVSDFISATRILKEEIQRAGLSRSAISAFFTRVHYKHHFRAPISLRPFYDASGKQVLRRELGVEMGQYGSAERFRAQLRDLLQTLAAGGSESDGGVRLEPYTVASASVAWQFNHYYWQHLHQVEVATGRPFDAVIGSSPDRNVEFTLASARAYYDRVIEASLQEQTLVAVEIGVAGVHRAKVFLDELKRLCELTGQEFYANTRYVLCDFSQSVLDAAQAVLVGDHPNVVTMLMRAEDPEPLRQYSGKILMVHLADIYNNLPTDRLARIGQQYWRLESRLYLPGDDLVRIVHRYELSPAQRDQLQQLLYQAHQEDGVTRLLETIRPQLEKRGRFIEFWMELYNALRQEDRYVAIDDIQQAAWSGMDSVENLGDMIEQTLRGQPDVWVQLSNFATRNLTTLLPMLHENGWLEVVDIVVREISDYHQRFRGPAKFEGSVVDWVNGPLLSAAAEQLGFQIICQSFKPFEPTSRSVILTAMRKMGP